MVTPGSGPDLGSSESPPSPEDRARVTTLLDDAVASGRITRTERDQRLESADTATTVGQLTALTADLGTREPGAGTVNEDL
jgi:hypothetical protein